MRLSAASIPAVLACLSLLSMGGGKPPGKEGVLQGLLSSSLAKRLQAARDLSRLPEKEWKALVFRLGNTGAALAARVRGLIRRLGAERWEDREAAEKDLVRIGKRAVGFLKEAQEGADLLEIRWRAARALKRIRESSPTMEEEWARSLTLSRALAWALMLHPPRDPARIQVARKLLATALWDADKDLRLLAMRGLARLGDRAALKPLEEMVAQGSPLERLLGLEGLLDLGLPEAREKVRAFSDGEKEPLFGLAARGFLLARGIRPPAWKGPAFLDSSQAEPAPQETAALPPPVWKFDLTGKASLQGGLLTADPAGIRLDLGPGGAVFLPVVTFVSGRPAGAEEGRGKEVSGGLVFFRSGTALPGRVLALHEGAAQVETAFLGRRTFPFSALRGWSLGGGGGEHPGVTPGLDLVVLEDGTRLSCRVKGLGEGLVRVEEKGKPRKIPLERIQKLSISVSNWGPRFFPRNPFQNLLVHSWKLAGGGEARGVLLFAGPDGVRMVDPFAGFLRIPLDRVERVRFRVGLGRGLGLTLVCDLEESRVVEFNLAGKEIWSFKDLDGGPLDAEWLPDGDLLVSDEGGNVREVTRSGKVVWRMGGLSLPYDVDKLPDGNYLIADTGHKRVIEVDSNRKVVWSYSGVTPYDVQRLPNGDTLIADASKDRVIQVNRKGKIVWSVDGFPEVRDADRLPDGDTLITSWGNHSVVEVDRKGNVVWKLGGLETPTDADRLSGGLTMVAESGRVRVVDWSGRTVWSVPVGWAVEANRY